MREFAATGGELMMHAAMLPKNSPILQIIRVKTLDFLFLMRKLAVLCQLNA
jgi:hypothetical protein